MLNVKKSYSFDQLQWHICKVVANCEKNYIVNDTWVEGIELTEVAVVGN